MHETKYFHICLKFLLTFEKNQYIIFFLLAKEKIYYLILTKSQSQRPE